MNRIYFILCFFVFKTNCSFSQDWVSFIDEEEPLSYINEIANDSFIAQKLKGKISEENIMFYQFHDDTMKEAYTIRRLYNNHGDITECYSSEKIYTNISQVDRYNYSQPGLRSEYIGIRKYKRNRSKIYKRNYKHFYNSEGKVGYTQVVDTQASSRFLESKLYGYYKDFDIQYEFNSFGPDSGCSLGQIVISGSGNWKFSYLRIGVGEYFPNLKKKDFYSDSVINNYPLLIEKYKPRLINQNAFEITINGAKHLFLRNYSNISYSADTIQLDGEKIPSKNARIKMLDKNNYVQKLISFTTLMSGKVEVSKRQYKWHTSWISGNKSLRIYSTSDNGKDLYVKYLIKFKNSGNKTEAKVYFWDYYHLNRK